MKALPQTVPFLDQDAASRGTSSPFRMRTRFIADWRQMLFVHFSIPAHRLAPHVPFELDTYEGTGFVSFVFFRLENMHPPGTGGLGRLLLRPISDHLFLNVRTYVKHNGSTGIQFLAEWIPNPLSLRLGPATYGLPYRLGEFFQHRKDGVNSLEVYGKREKDVLRIDYPGTPSMPPAQCARGTSDEFLLERYTAFTCLKGIKRRFDVAHTPWLASRMDGLTLGTDLVQKAFPWFR